MIDHIDHVVLITAHEKDCIRFYTEILGMSLQMFSDNRKAFHFGQQKINLLIKSSEFFDPNAAKPMPGTLDLCFIADIPIVSVIERLGKFQVPIIEGPVIRTGATGKIISVYVHDPDRNLIEISEIVDE